jgi:hypothetical protein
VKKRKIAPLDCRLGNNLPGLVSNHSSFSERSDMAQQQFTIPALRGVELPEVSFRTKSCKAWNSWTGPVVKPHSATNGVWC